MLSQQFPDELKQFYLEVGYGYLGYDDPDFKNQIMHPLEIAKLKLGLDFYGNMFTDDLAYYTSGQVFPFFDLGGEADYLVIQLRGDPSGSVIYCGRPIASSFQEFVKKMCEKTGYFIGNADGRKSPGLLYPWFRIRKASAGRASARARRVRLKPPA